MLDKIRNWLGLNEGQIEEISRKSGVDRQAMERTARRLYNETNKRYTKEDLLNELLKDKSKGE